MVPRRGTNPAGVSISIAYFAGFGYNGGPAAHTESNTSAAFFGGRKGSPQNTAGGSGRYLHRTVPSRQQSARAFLQGEVPGVQQSYAPNARPSETEGWVEDDETVERLARWREEAPYG